MYEQLEIKIEYLDPVLDEQQNQMAKLFLFSSEVDINRS